MRKPKVKTRKNLCKEYDIKRSELIKKKANYRCEYCWKEKRLNSHHIFTRNNYSTRYDIENGCCLCSGCHTMSSKFSAHKTPADFIERIKSKRWEEWYNRIRLKAKRIWDKDYEEIRRYLEEEEQKINDLYNKESECDTEWQKN